MKTCSLGGAARSDNRRRDLVNPTGTVLAWVYCETIAVVRQARAGLFKFR